MSVTRVTDKADVPTRSGHASPNPRWTAALVTGGSSGVGLALARRLVADGTTVLVCGRDPGRLADAAAQIPGLRTLVADLADPDDVGRLARAAADLPGLDLVVHNAAVQLDRDWVVTQRPGATGPLVRDAAAELAADLGAPLHLTAHLLPVLAQAPHAAVVSVTSALGTVPKRSAPVYCAAKAGLSAFTTSLRYQLRAAAPHVRAIEVALPLVDTAMTAGRGARKITPDAAASAILSALTGRRDRVHVGPVRILLSIHRVAPRLAARIVAD
ncbi:SDR family NAD(P)-dependent oxidoreductase [Oerskovia turbata]|uniref:SDR family NAD(P)-dependent oxidoreductase n=1 Tax=Oerskovia turbata TaxID=1713 RepID=A0A4Q1KXN2_9CELL|nr:SDR family NAD(P)-dependent oxidoreductase [Oerskovia turbata]RXR24839.1 SDR family NAD(P)-dependent oxidoreductase [Oerskovia turbata]RXR34957.1 SDR family NAD(P)-dependent oxidoreductase [Oerskovia turbata]TGJ97017.1 KR domain-containing protein [Actinotalea fermentans ATCC 43279 = JCM 9966 = DSM 3133]